MDALSELCDSIQKMLFKLRNYGKDAILFDDEVDSLTKKKNYNINSTFISLVFFFF